MPSGCRLWRWLAGPLEHVAQHLLALDGQPERLAHSGSLRAGRRWFTVMKRVCEAGNWCSSVLQLRIGLHAIDLAGRHREVRRAHRSSSPAS